MSAKIKNLEKFAIKASPHPQYDCEAFPFLNIDLNSLTNDLFSLVFLQRSIL